MTERDGTTMTQREAKGRLMGRHSAPSTESTDSGPEFTTPRSRHRSPRRHRGIAGWPVVAAAVLVLGVLGWFGWGWANSEVDSRANAQASACSDGNAVLRVATPESAERATRTAAERWNAKRTVVHGHCVRVEVVTSDPGQVWQGLTSGWRTDQLGPRPHAWIADDPAQTRKLGAAHPELVSSTAEPVPASRTTTVSFVALGGADVTEVQIRAAQSFRSFMQEKPGQRAR